MSRGLPTLVEAIEWTREHWQGRDLPSRIHEHAVEPGSLLGSPKLTAAMMSYLLAAPDDTLSATETVVCHHPRLDRGVCPDCTGGVKDVTVCRRRYPMWRALWKLSKAEPSIAGLPKPIWIVLSLWAASWEVERVTIRNGDGLPVDRADRDGLVLISLRKLHGWYEETPIPRLRHVEVSVV